MERGVRVESSAAAVWADAAGGAETAGGLERLSAGWREVRAAWEIGLQAAELEFGSTAGSVFVWELCGFAAMAMAQVWKAVVDVTQAEGTSLYVFFMLLLCCS